MVDVVVKVNPHPHVTISGAVGTRDIHSLDVALAPVLAERPRTVTLDLSGVVSPCPRLAVWLLDLAHVVDSVVLHAPSERVRRLLDLAGVANRFVFETP